MAASRPKRDQSVRELLAKAQPTQKGTTPGPVETRTPVGHGESGDEGEAPITKGFLTSLFDSLRNDLQELRRDFAQELKEVRGEVTSLGDRVAAVEDGEISRGEELEVLQQEVVRLREQQHHLQLTVEDLENRSRRHNIRIRGAPPAAERDDIGEFVGSLFREILELEEGRVVTLDRVHRVGRRGGDGERPPDILACVQDFGTKERILQRTRNLDRVQFRGHSLQLFQDLSPRTLQRRRDFRPITEFLRARAVSYSWGHPFRLLFRWDDRLRQVTEVAEARRVLGLEDGPQAERASTEIRDGDQTRWRRQGKKRKQRRPTQDEQALERRAVLSSLAAGAGALSLDT